jgi:hypothetical protein
MSEYCGNHIYLAQSQNDFGWMLAKRSPLAEELA